MWQEVLIKVKLDRELKISNPKELKKEKKSNWNQSLVFVFFIGIVWVSLSENQKRIFDITTQTKTKIKKNPYE